MVWIEGGRGGCDRACLNMVLARGYTYGAVYGRALQAMYVCSDYPDGMNRRRMCNELSFHR